MAKHRLLYKTALLNLLLLSLISNSISLQTPFDVEESSKANEQAQAAQNQVQNFISKYSKYKSSN